MEIDWNEIARKIGAIGHCSSRLGNAAIVELLGEEVVQGAVDYYVAECGSHGAEVARQVLWNLQPAGAMHRCYEIYRTDPDVQRKRNAVDLLRAVADDRALPWVPGLLDDEDEMIQSYGGSVVDQLLWSEMATVEACRELLAGMEHHANRNVRETHAFIVKYLSEREEAPEGPGDD